MKKLIALCMLVALLLSACSTKPAKENTEAVALPTEPQIPSSEPVATKEDGEFGLSYMPQYGLNPYLCTATINRALFSLLYEPLFAVNNEFAAVPVLCDSFKVSDNGTVYRFSLLPEARFSDGARLRPEDVAASLRAAQESPLYSERLEHIRSIYVMEDGRLEITLDTPYENFALMLDVPIMKEGTMEDAAPIGTGPYRLSGRALVKNKHWWGEEHGVLSWDTIELSTATKSSDLRDHFEFGATDLVYCDPNSTAAGSYRCDYEVWEAPTTIMHYLGFNLYSGWFINETLRSGMTFAIDRDAFANEIYGGFAQPTPLPCSPSSHLNDPQLYEEYDYAPAKFAEAVNNSGVLTSEEFEGHVGTFLVCIDDPVRVELAERITKVLNDAGIRMNLSALEREAYESALNRSAFDVYLGEVRLTASFDLSEFFMKYGNLQFGSIQNTGLVTLCTEALANSGTYSELYRQILNDAPICPIAFKSFSIYVTRGMITSNAPGVDLVFHYKETERSLADADKTYEDEEQSHESP